MSYFVYILECADKTLYIGTTNDLKRRLHAHNFSKSAAKYTRGRRPVKLRYSIDLKTKSKALKKEMALKNLTRAEKLMILQ